MRFWNVILWMHTRSWEFFKILVTTFVKALVEIVFLRWNDDDDDDDDNNYNYNNIIIIIHIPYFTAL